MNTSTPAPVRSLTTPTIDFLLLGGASLYVWAIMVSIGIFLGAEANTKFFYFAVMFNWLSIICNYPHFLVSYRFGYGRGKKFILKQWPALILVPIGLILFYVIAYFFFNEPIRSYSSVIWLNGILTALGMDYQIGALPNLGIEILSLSVRLMFITSAWHYAKQAFGCIMVFSHFQKYPLTKFQRNLWKVSLYSVAVYNFFYVSNLMSVQGPFSSFRDVPVTNSIFPESFATISFFIVLLLALAVFYFIILKNYKLYKMKPTSSVVIPWIALHFWWMPFLNYNDFYFLAVPFFHSLQYLLFAYQLEAPESKTVRIQKIKILVMKMLVLFLVGWLSFEYVPEYLDSAFSTYHNFHVVFFIIALPVFINIHHFFIDSVVWRFSDEHIKSRLLQSVN